MSGHTEVEPASWLSAIDAHAWDVVTIVEMGGGIVVSVVVLAAAAYLLFAWQLWVGWWLGQTSIEYVKKKNNNDNISNKGLR